jgi:GTPase SAR1 family protein
MYYRGAQAALIVYDVTSRVSLAFEKHYYRCQKDSFEGAKTLVLEIKRNEFLTDAHFVLVANKIDNQSQRVVSEQEGREYAHS